LKFREFNNPSKKFVLSTVTMLAYDMFDSRQSLSVENIGTLMRHWMRGIQSQICGESKHEALFDGLAQSVAEHDGPLAGKEMRALLESGYLKFVKHGRGYMRPVSRMRSSIKLPRIAALSRPGSSASSGAPLSLTVAPSFSSSHFQGTHISSPLASGPLEPNELSTRVSVDDSDNNDSIGLDTEDEEEEEEKASRLRLVLERLHATAKELGCTDVWGDTDAEIDVINSYCDQEERDARKPARGSTNKQRTDKISIDKKPAEEN
jgi:hypothetical protein